jgi:hypothetical protein
MLKFLPLISAHAMFALEKWFTTPCLLRLQAKWIDTCDEITSRKLVVNDGGDIFTRSGSGGAC